MIYSDYWWVFFLPGLLIGLYAQIKLSSTYSKYLRVGTASGLTGAAAAREILDRSGLHSVPVQPVRGHLTDHYDPLKRALFLSEENYSGRSIAAVGVAAHEAGHALQHQAAYGPLQLRMAMVPATRFASMAWMGILVLGMFTGGLTSNLIWIAVAIFAVITFFQLVTLPVEFDASRRAKVQLLQYGLIQSQEAPHVSRVLNAAALTYVAALVTSVLQLLRILMIARGRR